MYYFAKNTKLNFLMEKTLKMFFPPDLYCSVCGRPADDMSEFFICDECTKAINWGNIRINLERERRVSGMTQDMDSVLSCMVYGLHSKRLIFDLKYNHKTYLARQIAQIMSDRILNDRTTSGLAEVTDVIIPVPVHESKIEERGFNQAELISEELTVRLNAAREEGCIRHLPNALLRKRKTIEQRSVKGFERYANLRDTFEVNEAYEKYLKDAIVILVDDIFTTGATTGRCAEVLKKSGAAEVHVITLATGNFYLEGQERPRNDEEFLEEIKRQGRREYDPEENFLHD